MNDKNDIADEDEKVIEGINDKNDIADEDALETRFSAILQRSKDRQTSGVYGNRFLTKKVDQFENC